MLDRESITRLARIDSCGQVRAARTSCSTPNRRRHSSREGSMTLTGLTWRLVRCRFGSISLGMCQATLLVTLSRRVRHRRGMRPGTRG